MPIHLQRELENLNRLTLSMCAHVEQNVRDACRAFLENDVELARKIIVADRDVDKMEIELSENCLKVLALYQPVASDLRFIFSLSKIAGILERIGDLAENLARKTKTLSQLDAVPVPAELAEMAEFGRSMLKDSIDSYIERDTAKAKKVIMTDAAVNLRKRQVRKIAEAAIQVNPVNCRQWLVIVAASRNIERIGDMAANIAAEVVYTIDGKMIRHGFDSEE